MSMHNSQKEFYYSLYINRNKEVLEKVLRTKLIDGELDKNFGNRKVDMYFKTQNMREVFVEIQLNQSDEIHLKQLTKIIDSNEKLNNCILVWIASQFKIDLLDAMQEKINKSHRNIFFIALKFNNKIIEHLEKLNDMRPVEVIDNLAVLNDVKEQLTVISVYYRVQQEEELHVRNIRENDTINLDNKIGIMKYLLAQLRREIYYYPSLHRQKKLDNLVIVVGSGIADASFAIGINRSNFVFVEFRCNENTKHIFELLMRNKDEIDDKFDYFIEWNEVNLKVSSFLFYRNKNREQILKQAVRIFKKYIDYFTQFTFQQITN